MRGLFWFRNDLRLGDQRGLSELASRVEQMAAVFVLDPRLLSPQRTGAARVRFLLDSLERLARDLEAREVPLVVRRGRPEQVIPRLVRDLAVGCAAWNRDSTPFARARDERVRAALARNGVAVIEAKDRVVFEAAEVRTRQGRPYSVYTPYRNEWMRRWREAPDPPLRAPRLPAPIPGVVSDPIPDPASLGFGGDRTQIPTGGERAAHRRLGSFLDRDLARYAQLRDVPADDATSRLSAHLRFGTISARACLAAAMERVRDDARRAGGGAKWIDELVWREFHHAILEVHPRVMREAYQSDFARVEWNEDEEAFRAWCEGRTGYPIVDAGMRQLAATGWMHNRVRMIAASFLVKDLLVDWRRGEAFFFRHLVDADPANNNGGWQWCASTGTDPMPWFRIFDPTAQGERFDPDGRYVRRWVPELRAVEDRCVHRPWRACAGARDYPAPIVDHAERRRLALRRFETARARARAVSKR